MSRDVVYEDWRSAAEFERGTCQGTAVVDDAVTFGLGPAGTRSYVDPYGDGTATTYEQSVWLSPEVRPGFAFTELIPSWNASTPQGTWIELEVRVSEDGMRMSRWYTFGCWAESDTDLHSASVRGQDDDLASVCIDVLTARAPRTLSTYQLRVSLHRRVGSTLSPSVRLVGMMASNIPAAVHPPVPEPASAWGTVLEVPAYSQQVHRGEYPQWDNGGESWCSPTSTSMLLSFWGTGPTDADYAWVDPALQDRFIDYAARHTFDHSFGAGNWSFNTAYAARYGMIAFVTRLRSLTEVERFIEAGIPLVVTVSFQKSELEGAGYDTEGHLLTVIGFDEDGNVVSNDPASHKQPSNDAVRVTYDRAQFERVWLGSAGGVTYVIHPPDVELPERLAQPNW